MSVKRDLQISSWDNALEQIDRLSAGHQPQGKWNLAQCCEHLNQWMTFPMDGFPAPGIFMGAIFWVMRKTIGKQQLRTIIENGFKPGVPTLPQTVPAREKVVESEAVEKLKQTVQRFIEFNGPIYPSPLFGEMTKAEVERVQLRHFEHHLSFLEPR